VNRRRGLLASIFLALLASVLLAQPAQARDRPGTPNGGFTGNCGPYLTEEPILCVEFRNTATEKVGFLMEWTENGVLMPSDLSGRSDCITHSAQFYYCRALHMWFLGHTDFEQAGHLDQLINPTGGQKFNSDREYPEGFQIKGLLYDSEYCFRFMAVTQYGVRSGAWSGFTCARTPPPPPKPPAPATPKVTGIQPTSGDRVAGYGTPFRLLVEWTGPTVGNNNVGGYSVELWRKPQWVGVPITADPNRPNFSTAYEGYVEAGYLGPPEQRQAVRVCSTNIQQKSCSTETWYYGLIAPKDKASANPNIARVTPVPQTTVSMNPPLAGRAAATSQGRTTASANVGAALAATPAAAGAAGAADLDALAARGADAALQDPLAAQLRNGTSEGPVRRGFDVGFGVWIGNAAPGPGKQKVHDALNPAERPGFDIAAAFSLPRNKYARLAGVGAVIGNADAEVADARNAENDVFYWLGFDIASGIFGDPKAGSLGNTATGPGSLGIRNELNATAQRGFDAATALHLGRKYQ
jgi:hypothetical protein